MTDTRLAGPAIELPAAVSLGGHRVVASVSGSPIYADSSNNNLIGLVIGITARAVSAGQVALIQVYGPMSEVSWNWTPDSPLFVGADGALTQSAPTSGWVQEVARAISATRIMIDLQPPILLNL